VARAQQTRLCIHTTTRGAASDGRRPRTQYTVPPRRAEKPARDATARVAKVVAAPADGAEPFNETPDTGPARTAGPLVRRPLEAEKKQMPPPSRGRADHMESAGFVSIWIDR